MARNVIFGSGILGLIFKEILGDDWDVVPFSKSRYFSYTTPLCDNFITYDRSTDQLLSELNLNISPTKHYYVRRFSRRGALIPFSKENLDLWLMNIFGDSIPTQSHVYWNENRFSETIYVDARLTNIYSSLLHKHNEYLVGRAKLGNVTNISKNSYEINGQVYNFDNAISTIPLNVLYALMGLDNSQLRSLPLYCYFIKTDKLNFEGANQVFACDPELLFFKVSNIQSGYYIFYSTTDIPNPGIHFMRIIGGEFDIIDGTSIQNTIPVNEIPNTDYLNTEYNIYPIGSCAQWDWCMDVGSCLVRFVKYWNKVSSL